jgi:hypothetical protein
VDPDGPAHLLPRIYRTRTIVEDHAKPIRELTSGAPSPLAIVCDHDADDRATLERHIGMGTVGAFKAVSPGIQAMTTRLRDAGNGRPRIASCARRWTRAARASPT